MKKIEWRCQVRRHVSTDIRDMRTHMLGIYTICREGMDCMCLGNDKIHLMCGHDGRRCGCCCCCCWWWHTMTTTNNIRGTRGTICWWCCHDERGSREGMAHATHAVRHTHCALFVVVAPRQRAIMWAIGAWIVRVRSSSIMRTNWRFNHQGSRSCWGGGALLHEWDIYSTLLHIICQIIPTYHQVCPFDIRSSTSHLPATTCSCCDAGSWNASKSLSFNYD